MPTIADLNKKYAGTQTVSAPPKPNLVQKTGSFLGNVGKAIATPFARLGVEGYNVASGVNKAVHGDMAGANATLDQPRNLPLLGQTKPTLTNSSKPGLAQGLDIAGQGIQLGADALGGEGFGSGVINGIKTGATIGATQGFGNALTQTKGKSFGQNVGNIAQQTAIGGATGGAIGGAVNAIHPIFSRSTPIMKAEDISGNSAVNEAQQGVNAATKAREQAGVGAVEGVNQTLERVGQGKTNLGTTFEQGAKQIETINPKLKLPLSNKTLEGLNNLREGKNFALPSNLDQETNPLMGSTLGKAFLEKNAGKLADIENATKTELSPTQTQDLIRRLNKLTFDAKASGDLAVNQQTIGLTNEIKDAASKTFGPEWDKVYSGYSKGITAVNDLKDLISLSDKGSLDKTLNKVLKLGETPEGKAILKQAASHFTDETGIDLTDPVKAMHQILDKQIALEEAQSGLTAAQKEAQAIAKKGTGWDQFKRGAGNREYLGKRLVEGVAIGAGSSILIYPALRKLAKEITGQP